MDAAAQLALVSKAERVFGNEDTLLSFPVTPLAFTRASLELTGDRALENLIEFSMLVNAIPDGTAWTGSGGTLLWEVYDRVLREAQFANSTRSPDEEAAYRAARALLHQQEPDGSLVPTVAYRAYREYRDRYLLLQQEYLSQKATAEAGGPESPPDWLSVRQPALKRALDDALGDWKVLGHRDDIEQAEARVRILGARSPWQTVGEWKDRFNSDLDTLTRPSDQQRVYPTSYAPANALADGAWRRFELSGPEIDEALAQAPEVLRQRLGGNGDHGIASITFEFSSAGLVRPWFSADLFTARFWRFGDPLLQLSDGEPQVQGICPAYPVALVFARNVAVKHKSATAAPATGKELHFDARLVAQLRPAHKLVRWRQPPPPSPGAATRPGVAPAAVLRSVAPVAMKMSRPPATTAPALTTMLLKRHATMVRPAQPGATPAVRNVQKTLSTQPLQRLQRNLYTRPPAATPAPPAAAADTADDSVFILALLCRRLPRSPDPDPALAW